MTGEAQSYRSIAAEIESDGIVRALEAYSGPAELLGDDNIVLRITTDREIDAATADARASIGDVIHRPHLRRIWVTFRAPMS